MTRTIENRPLTLQREYSTENAVCFIISEVLPILRACNLFSIAGQRLLSIVVVLLATPHTWQTKRRNENKMKHSRGEGLWIELDTSETVQDFCKTLKLWFQPWKRFVNISILLSPS